LSVLILQLYKGLKGIPQDWIKKTNPAKSILKFIA